MDLYENTIWMQGAAGHWGEPRTSSDHTWLQASAWTLWVVNNIWTLGVFSLIATCSGAFSPRADKSGHLGRGWAKPLKMRDREKFSTKIGKQKPPAHSYSECGPARPEKKIENDVKTSLWAVVVIGLSFHAKILEDGILTCAKSWHCSLKAKVFARNAFASVVSVNWNMRWDGRIVAWDQGTRSWTRTQQKRAGEVLPKARKPSGSDPNLFRIRAMFRFRIPLFRFFRIFIKSKIAWLILSLEVPASQDPTFAGWWKIWNFDICDNCKTLLESAIKEGEASAR